jgi:hypothetical protein
VKQLVERALRKLWGPRWNAIARGEFLRSFSTDSILVLAILVFLMNGVVVTVWIWDGPTVAGWVARGLVALSWFVVVGMTSGPMGRMFALDDKLGTTEGWLLTSAPRQKLLWARLAGQSAQGPLLIIGLFPVYCVAAASLRGAALGLFVCGHVARPCGFSVPVDFTIPSMVAAAPVALLAMLADASATILMGANGSASAVENVGTGDLVTSIIGSWWRWGTRSFLVQLGITALTVLVEGGCAAVSGLAAYWMTTNAHLPAWAETVIGLAFGAVLAALLVDRRLALAGSNIDFAAEHYDEALIRDEPE